MLPQNMNTDEEEDDDDIMIGDLMELIGDISFEIDDEYKSVTDYDLETLRQYVLESHVIPNFVIAINSSSDLYENQLQIGRGSSGAVYLTKSKQTCKQYALKQMQRSDEHNLLSFANEINVLKSLNHPNIVNFNDAYISSEYYFVATEYCSGGTLHERIMKMKRFSEQDCVAFMKTILETIHYIHNNKIVHRDLKLTNIVFDSLDIKHSKLQIIDFGESEIIDKPQNIDKAIVGSRCFLPPEINRHRRKQDLYAGDMWSIGVIAYILIEGCMPYIPKNVHEVMHCIHTNPLKWNEKILITDSCKHFIQCLLHKDLHKRLTAKEALQHAWITNQAADNNLGDAYFARLQTLNFRNKLQKVMVKAVLNGMNDAVKETVLSHDGYSDDTELINTILFTRSSSGLKVDSSPKHAFSETSLDEMAIDDILAEIDAESGTQTGSEHVPLFMNVPSTPSVDDTIDTEQFVNILKSSSKHYDIPDIVSKVTDDGISPITFRKIAAFHQQMDTLNDININKLCVDFQVFENN